MKTKLPLVPIILLLAVISASSQATTQKFTPGWDNFTQPINFTKSNVKWSVSTTKTNKLIVTYTLVGATPSKLYQVALNFFCSKFPATFGQFPTDLGGGACTALTRQGVTRDSAEVEVGVVLTDVHGNGALSVVIASVPSGTYDLEFFVRDGAGCDISGGAGDGPDCAVDFQSPGPFGTGITLTVP
jgi:hypothetical protein